MQEGHRGGTQRFALVERHFSGATNPAAGSEKNGSPAAPASVDDEVGAGHVGGSV